MHLTYRRMLFFDVRFPVFRHVVVPALFAGIVMWGFGLCLVGAVWVI